ncbi:MAG TPA: hypothetical protein VFC10_18860 [Terriglobia bacterium]|jgi:hypothetical protein|nr:hypothetical protein [Terriglobia bacterium]
MTEKIEVRFHPHGRLFRRILHSAFCILALVLFCRPLVSSGQQTGVATLTYTKVLKGSVPEYISITVDRNGVGTYDGRQLDESPRPRALKLLPETTEQLFQIAASLNDFRSIRLESNKNVANMGLKTFIYRDDGQENKVEFNYTQNKKAQDLVNLFEGIADVEEHIGALEYSARYDVLGLPRALTQVEIDLNNKALVDPELMVPILKKIAGDSQYLHIAQVRAADILRRIQDPNSQTKSGQHRE